MPFAETLTLLEEIRRLYHSACDQCAAEFRAEQESYFRRRFPGRRKVDFELVSADPEFLAIRDKWQLMANKLTETCQALEAAIGDRLREESFEEVPVAENAAGVLGLVYTARALDFRTQGLGASRYAQGAAELKADVARYYGFRAEVLPVGMETHSSDGCRYQDYGVFSNVTETGWQMLMRRDGPPLREWLKACWRRGVNPRVYYPLLPVGLEERLHVDYLGNDRMDGPSPGSAGQRC